MPVVSVRLPEEDLMFLKARNANVSDVIRTALHERIEWMRWQEAQKRLGGVRFKPSRPSKELIRDDRDQR